MGPLPIDSQWSKSKSISMRVLSGNVSSPDLLLQAGIESADAVVLQPPPAAAGWSTADEDAQVRLSLL